MHPRVLTHAAWQAIDQGDDLSTIADMLDARYRIEHLPDTRLVLGTDRYIALDVLDDTLRLALWTRCGARKGQEFRWPLSAFNHEAGPDELRGHLWVLFQVWDIPPVASGRR